MILLLLIFDPHDKILHKEATLHKETTLHKEAAEGANKETPNGLNASKALRMKSNDQKASSSGSTHEIIAKETDLVPPHILKSLPKKCLWLHTWVSNFPEDPPIEVELEMTQLHYYEDATTWVSKSDIIDFLCQKKLNVSVIQAMMR